MHVILPYDNDPTTRILFDEPYTNESLPQAIEMAGGLVFFNSEPFIGYDDKPTRLDAPEAGALALTSVGMSTEQTVDRLDRQFDCGSAPLESMYAKLDVAGRQAGIMAVAAAFNKKIYLPEQAPD
jgi:hypothetical protein